ncbi:MAG: hypothetical protein HY820_32735 [Acidobacteria bacterium]|nr:hypothetical protein [Acidobacteriota bacterium]
MNHRTTRRTTLTLPTGSLDLAERIARRRHLNLSAIVGEALERGLREEEQNLRSDAILRSYRKAFAGFSPEELLLLDGILVEETVEPRAPGEGNRRGRK